MCIEVRLELIWSGWNRICSVPKLNRVYKINALELYHSDQTDLKAHLPYTYTTAIHSDNPINNKDQAAT